MRVREQFNPIGLVFRTFKRPAIFRFWQPFREAKHSKPHTLERLKSDLWPPLAAAKALRYSCPRSGQSRTLLVSWSGANGTRNRTLEQERGTWNRVLYLSLLRKDEPLFGAGGIAKKNRLRIDRDDGVAAGDRLAYANDINLSVA